MSAFRYLTNRLNSSYEDIVDLSKKKKDVILLKYWVNGLLRGNNWSWIKCTTLSWDWISNKSLLPINNSMHSKCMKKLVLNRDIAWKSFWNGMERWMYFQWKYPPIFQASQATIWKLENCVNGLLLGSDEKLENIYNPELVLDFEQKAIYQSTILYAKRRTRKLIPIREKS